MVGREQCTTSKKVGLHNLLKYPPPQILLLIIIIIIIYFVGTITVHVPKRNAGQYFDNLGMITALLSKKPAGTASKTTSKPLIEVLPGHSVNIILLLL